MITITRLDHGVIGVRDLDEAIQTWPVRLAARH